MTIRSDPAVAPEATFTAADGSTERAEFRGREGERLLAHVHLPAAAPRGAVLICSPLYGELLKNYRRDVLLARRLVHHGFAVERFHYRFSGNSDGDDADLTFDSMRQDALDCIEDVRRHVPEGPLFLVGTRWGALIAASAASEHPGAGLVLWEPLLDVTRFFKEAFRSRLVKDRRDGVEHPLTGKELEERLRGGQSVEVVATRIEPGLYRSATGRTLEGEMGTAGRPILAIQVGPTGAVRQDLERLAGRWREAGIRVDAIAVRGAESWWLVDERWHDEGERPMTKELISLTARWIDERTSEGGAR